MEKKWLGKQILDGHDSANESPPDGSVIGKETVNGKTMISGSLSRKEDEEETPCLRKSIGDDDKTKGERFNQSIVFCINDVMRNFIDQKPHIGL